jgi:hypothetical protein
MRREDAVEHLVDERLGSLRIFCTADPCATA